MESSDEKLSVFLNNSMADEISSDDQEKVYKSSCNLVLTTVTNDHQYNFIRTTKRRYDHFESDSDESVDKWLKIDNELDHFCDSETDNSPNLKRSPHERSNMKTWNHKQRLASTYGLRPRPSLRKCFSEGDADFMRKGPRRGSPRCRATKRVAMSKYRRSTANARERERMRDINTAFSALRGALPAFATAQMSSMTKITTLQLASSYIRALSDMLQEPPQYSVDNQHAESGQKWSEMQTGNYFQSDIEENNNVNFPNRNFTSDSTQRNCSSREQSEVDTVRRKQILSRPVLETNHWHDELLFQPSVTTTGATILQTKTLTTTLTDVVPTATVETENKTLDAPATKLRRDVDVDENKYIDSFDDLSPFRNFYWDSD